MKIIFFDILNDSMLNDWKMLWEKSPFATLSNSPAWFLSALETYSPKKIKIIACYDDEINLVGIMGLFQEKMYGLWVWKTPASEFSDKEPLLIDYNNSELVKGFLQSLPTIGTVCLSNFSEKTILPILDLANVSVFTSDTNLFIDFAVGPYGILKQRKIKLMKNRLSISQDEMVCIPDRKDRAIALETIFKIEKESSKYMHGKGTFHDPQSRIFYTQLLNNAPENLILTTVTINNKPVAYSICFVNQHAMQGSQKAHNPSYNYFNLGRLLVTSLCDYARSLNQTFFDLGRGSDEFKKSFATRSENLYTTIISTKIIKRKYLTFMLKNREKLYNKTQKFNMIYLLYKKMRKEL